MMVASPRDESDRPWPFARELVHLDSAESTNTVARQLALEGRDDLPLAVWADRQTKGRGRGANAWWSDAGSLTFSLLIDPDMHGIKPEHEPKLALAAALAVIDTIARECRLFAGIRWPNDIELDGRKLGGILPERVETPRGTRLVAGIGLNVSTRLDDAPEDVRRMAVSLAELMPSATPVPGMTMVLRGVLAAFGTTIDRLVRDESGLAAEWASADCLLNRAVRVDVGPRVVSGIGRGIDADGALVVDCGGVLERLFGGRVLRG